MSQDNSKTSMPLFWGCFMALIATGFGFISRMFLIDTWAAQFNLDPAQAGRLAGIGIWPFAVSIIAFSLFIDRLGYKRAMTIAFIGHLVWAVMGVSAYFVADKATGFALLYWGSLILGLANGTVEAFINPVVATMFSKEKTKYLNMLHAAWPGGLVLAGLITIAMASADWWIKVGIIAVPATVYFLMLIGKHFPENERVSAGISYKDMLSEFGVLGALIVGFLVVLQLMDFFSNGSSVVLSGGQKAFFIGIGVVLVAAFGIYTKSLGRPLLAFLCLIMFPLATTEIGTDGWITSIMKPVMVANGFDPGWILVYTSAIMLPLRFVAGPIIKVLGPIGLLITSAVLAILGLTYLSAAAGVSIILAATLYGFGKTFFWPTMLGVVAEQTPKGGALTLNAVSGIGMLAVGTLGFPFIGVLQADKAKEAVVTTVAVGQAIPGLIVDGKVSPKVLNDKAIYEVLTYQTIDGDKVKGTSAVVADPAKNIKAAPAVIGLISDPASKLTPDQQKAASKAFDEAVGSSSQHALGSMAKFPMVMLICYVLLFLLFRSRGGYKAIGISDH